MDETLGFIVGDKVIALVPVECEVIGWKALEENALLGYDDCSAYTISCVLNGELKMFTAYNGGGWLPLEAFDTVNILQKKEEA